MSEVQPSMKERKYTMTPSRARNEPMAQSRFWKPRKTEVKRTRMTEHES